MQRKFQRLWILMMLTLTVTLLPQLHESPTHAQTINSPALLLVIVLDDSKTNITGTENNTITVEGGITLNRQETDGNDYRADAIVDLIRHLQSDRNSTHKVAIFRFANNPAQSGWILADSQTPDQQFIPVGGGGSSTLADQLITAVKNRPMNIITGGPGQLDDAMLEATSVLESQYNTNQGLKPVVWLIADDVPIQDNITNSPFQNPSNWQSQLVAFEDPLSTVVNPSIYMPYPSTNPCSIPSGGATFAVFAMGAANWVNSDGTTDRVPDTVNENQPLEYFPALATRLNAIAIKFTLNEEGQLEQANLPLAYRIDPLYADSTGAQLRSDLQTSVLELHRALRCATPVERSPQRAVGTDQIEFSFNLSAFYKQTRITVTLPLGGTVTFSNQSGQAQINELPSILYGDQTRRLYTLTPSDSAWATGQWTVTISGATSADVYVEADIDTDGLGRIINGELTELTPGESEDYTITLTKNGVELREDVLIDSLSASLGRTGLPDVALEVAKENGLYQLAIERDKAPESGEYYLYLTLNLRGLEGTLLYGNNTEMSLERVELQYVTGFEILADYPRPDNDWLCDDTEETVNATTDDLTKTAEGTTSEIYAQRLSVITRQSSEGANPDSLGSFTEVEVYYPPPDLLQEPPPTPLAGLTWQRESAPSADSIRYAGLIDCGLLQTGGGQTLVVVARFPGEETIYTLDLGFSLATFTPTPIPTNRPIESQTPTPTSPPTSTPTPARAEPFRNIGDRVLAPPLNYVLVIVLAISSIPPILGVVRAYFAQSLPLHKVEVLYPGETQTQPILAPWKRIFILRYIPQFQSQRLFHQRLWLCTIRGGEKGQLIITAGDIPIIVQAEALQPKNSTTSTLARITLTYSEIDDTTGLVKTFHQLIILNNNRGVS